MKKDVVLFATAFDFIFDGMKDKDLFRSEKEQMELVAQMYCEIENLNYLYGFVNTFEKECLDAMDIFFRKLKRGSTVLLMEPVHVGNIQFLKRFIKKDVNFHIAFFAEEDGMAFSKTISAKELKKVFDKDLIKLLKNRRSYYEKSGVC